MPHLAIRGLPADLGSRYEPIAFLTDRMAEALVASDLVLGRAGSSTCAELAAVGVASILVPYPHAAGHQQANAAWLVNQGATVMVPDAELDGDRLVAEATALLDDGLGLGCGGRKGAGPAGCRATPGRGAAGHGGGTTAAVGAGTAGW